MKERRRPPVLGIAAWSGTGKTTLLTRVLPLLREAGIRTGLLKHTHHDFEIDRPGKDSYRLRHAGAEQVLLGCSRRWALIVETPGREDDDLATLLGHFVHERLDLILVEGYKMATIPKIEVHRPSLGKPLLAPGDPGIIAVVTDAPLQQELSLPLLDLDDPGQVARFIEEWLASQSGHEVPALRIR